MTSRGQMTIEKAAALFSFPIDHCGPVMKRVYKIISSLARDGQRVLLFGPTGSGKEYLAYYYAKEALRQRSMASDKRFLAENCACLGELAQDELFGHVKGAFTGALCDKSGAFQLCQGGILFLDEVGEIPRHVQPQLLRAVDPAKGSVRKIGSDAEESTTAVTVLAATNQSPALLREDLRARLGHVVEVPGLDRRGEEITPALKGFAVEALARRRDFERRGWLQRSPEQAVVHTADSIVKKTRRFAERHLWRENFRSLRSAIDYAVGVAALSSEMREAQFTQEVAELFQARARFLCPQPVPDVSASARLDASDAYGFSGTDSPFTSAVARDVLHAFRASMRIDPQELQALADFIANTQGEPFHRREVEAAVARSSERAKDSASTARNRLKVLMRAGIIELADHRRGVYRLAALASSVSALAAMPMARKLIPERPRHELVPAQKQDVEELQNMLENTRGVYIAAEAGSGKTTVAKAVAEELSRTRRVLFWSFVQAPRYPDGVLGLARALHEALTTLGATDLVSLDENDSDGLAKWALRAGRHLHFFFEDGHRPLLILDNVERAMAQREHRELVTAILSEWTDCQLLLLGSKKPNFPSLPESCQLVEYQLRGLEP